MLYLFRVLYLCALVALPVGGCSEETAATGGSAGSGDTGGDGGTGGSMGDMFPCTEQGIRDAIAEGGGPHTFDCNGPTTAVTEAEIVIDNDVILDGQGTLTVVATLGPTKEYHRLFSIPEGATAELRGFSVQNGALLAEDGAGIANNGTLTIRDCVISRNTAGDLSGDSPLDFGSGGGIRNTGELAIIDSTISQNGSSWRDGGGISNAGEMTIVNSIVSRNGASDGRGGGIDNASSASLTITNSIISENWASLCSLCSYVGGGISNAGEMTIVNSIVSDNEGIGIENTGGTAVLARSTVTRSNGNGIDNAGEMAVIDSTVSENSVYENGGAGIVNRETLTLVNSTVTGNSADSYGGGIWNNGTLTLRSSTVTGNTAGEQGSAVYAYEGSVIDTALTLIDGDCASFVDDAIWISNGHNIESPSDTCGFDQPTDQVDVTEGELNLGPLQDNGGPTMTHALLSGSVAIDHIPADMCAVTEDQRGEPRDSMCDVGAFEVQP
jgi:hypothetical protein